MDGKAGSDDKKGTPGNSFFGPNSKRGKVDNSGTITVAPSGTNPAFFDEGEDNSAMLHKGSVVNVGGKAVQASDQEQETEESRKKRLELFF